MPTIRCALVIHFPRGKNPGSSWDSNQLNTSQTLLSYEYKYKSLVSLAEERKIKLHKQHCLEASAEFQVILTSFLKADQSGLN